MVFVFAPESQFTPTNVGREYQAATGGKKGEEGADGIVSHVEQQAIG